MPPRTTGSVGRPGQLAAPGSRSRPGRRAGSSGCRGTRRRRPPRSCAAGTAPAARLVRTSATTSPRTSTATSTTTNILTSSQKPSRTSGNESLNALQEKKVSRNVGQPGLVSTRAASPPRTMTVETAAIAWPRRRAAPLGRLAGGAAVGDGAVALTARIAQRVGGAGRPTELGARGAQLSVGRAGGLAHPALLDLLPARPRSGARRSRARRRR